jgi:hypothetical protein
MPCSAADILSGGYPAFIWLSIGGDDIIDGWLQGECKGNATGPSAAACYQVIYSAINTMLAAIYKALPLVQVGMFGYDFTNFIATQKCQETALLDFHGLDQKGINEVFLGYSTHVLEPLAQVYNALQFQYLPIWGTLQVIARVRTEWRMSRSGVDALSSALQLLFPPPKPLLCRRRAAQR